MLFWIFVIIFILSLAIFVPAKIIYNKHENVKRHAYDEWDDYISLRFYDKDRASVLRAQYELECTKFKNWKNSKIGKLIDQISNLDHSALAIGLICSITVSGIVSVAMLIGIGISNIDAPIKREEVLAVREVLVYELENDIYSDFGDDVVGKKELYNQIKDFNSELAVWKKTSNDFWIGIFYPNVVRDIDFIPLS